MLLFLTFKLLDRKKFFPQNLNSDGGAPLQHKSLTMNLESASQGDYPPKITTCCKDIVVCLTHVIGPHYICCLKLKIDYYNHQRAAFLCYLLLHEKKFIFSAEIAATGTVLAKNNL